MEIKVGKVTGLSKIVGLIGKKEVSAITFTTRFGIHTFGLRFPIDVLILDENNSVVVLKKNLKKNRIFLWNPKFNRVIELPQGFIEKNKIKKLDKVKIT